MRIASWAQLTINPMGLDYMQFLYHRNNALDDIPHQIFFERKYLLNTEGFFDLDRDVINVQCTVLIKTDCDGLRSNKRIRARVEKLFHSGLYLSIFLLIQNRLKSHKNFSTLHFQSKHFSPF
jgi:hypothetical protein